MPTKNVSIAGVTIDVPNGIPPGIQQVSVKFRIASDPDVPGSYVAVNAAAFIKSVEVNGVPSINYLFVNSSGNPQPLVFVIGQTDTDMDYAIVITVLCNNTSHEEVITVPGIDAEPPGSYLWQLKVSNTDPWLGPETLPTIGTTIYADTIANIGDPMVVPKTLPSFASLGGKYWELIFPDAVSNRGFQNNGFNSYAIPGSVYHGIISVGGIKSLVSLDINGIDAGADLVFTV